MLRTNSKQAKQNLQAYIMTAWNIEDGEEARSWEATASAVWSAFHCCAYSSEYERKQNEQKAFEGWLQGLPRGLGDFYLCQAVRDLGDILEETEEERSRYTEDQASEKLAALIYCEVKKGNRKNHEEHEASERKRKADEMTEREKAKIWQALRQAREEERANFEGFAKMNEGNEKAIEDRAEISIYILQGISYAEQEIAKAFTRQRKGRQ